MDHCENCVNHVKWHKKPTEKMKKEFGYGSLPNKKSDRIFSDATVSTVKNVYLADDISGEVKDYIGIQRRRLENEFKSRKCWYCSKKSLLKYRFFFENFGN